jgi:hypothetical protein
MTQSTVKASFVETARHDDNDVRVVVEVEIHCVVPMLKC